jgi:dTDP-4-amino-4,6-dideoxygalactose transaminase
VQGALADVGIPSVVYYPKPLHRQPAYAECPQARDLGVAESLGGEVLSLPMHPYLDAEVQNVVVESVRRAL